MAAAPKTSAVLREILGRDLELPADKVMAEAREKGVKADDKALRASIHTMKSDLRKKAAASATLAIPAAKPNKEEVAVATTPTPAPSPVVVLSPSPAPLAVLKQVTLVNQLVKVCGGVESAKNFLGVIELCGGIEMFEKTLEVVAEVRSEAAPS